MNNLTPSYLKKLRVAKGVSQARVAGLAGLHVNTINNMECENNRPSPSNLRRIYNALMKAPAPNALERAIVVGRAAQKELDNVTCT